MALDNINKAVQDAARAEADLILKAARKAADERVAAARREAEAEEERRYQAAVRAVEEDFSRKLIQLRGTANKELLAKKNARLQQVFDAARTQILGFSQEDYAAIMRRLLSGAVGNAPGKLRVHPQDKDCFQRLIAEINKSRAADTQLGLDESAPLAERGGFVFVSRDFAVDQTLATLLADIERDVAPEIAAELFGV